MTRAAHIHARGTHPCESCKAGSVHLCYDEDGCPDCLSREAELAATEKERDQYKRSFEAVQDSLKSRDDELNLRFALAEKVVEAARQANDEIREHLDEYDEAAVWIEETLGKSLVAYDAAKKPLDTP